MSNESNESVIVDTEPLLLFLIGIFDAGRISKIGDKRKYTKSNFDYLYSFLIGKQVMVTPQILTETFHFLKKLLGENMFSEFMKKHFALLSGVTEQYIEKDLILKRDEILRFDVADVSIILLNEVNPQISFITSDSKLFYECHYNGKPVIHIDKIVNNIF
ncbi:MAG TPA: hypothetical protein VI933_04510 [archaeon]|nr:hypothetical protein [archaeon]